ncbi:MAG: hypothetical protein ABIS29_01045 [Vicinamibacterales bacterium]
MRKVPALELNLHRNATTSRLADLLLSRSLLNRHEAIRSARVDFAGSRGVQADAAFSRVTTFHVLLMWQGHDA